MIDIIHTSKNKNGTSEITPKNISANINIIF